MANFFWIDATGLLGWDDDAGWSSTSGGLPGITIPANGDSVFFDENSTTPPIDVPNLSLLSLNTTGFGGTLPGFDSITITGTLTLANGDVYDGFYGASAVGIFSATSSNGGQSALPTGTFSGSSTNAFGSTVTNGTFNSGTANHGTVTSGVWNGTATNAADGTFTTGVFNGTSSNSSPTAGAMTINGSATNTGTATTLVIASDTGSNAGGTVTGKLTVPGTQAGGVLTSNIDPADLGTFGEIAISGASSGGGGGPLGGPEIRI